VPFICTLPGSQADIAIDAQAAVVPIGYDDIEPKSFTILVGFAASPGVVEADHETGQEFHLYSGLETKHIFNTLDRQLVLDAAFWATEKLLELVAPPRFFCCTYDADLPERALRKHQKLVERFRMCGYQVSPQPVQMGKHSWYLDKIESGS
jgi:hypothetical protein